MGPRDEKTKKNEVHMKSPDDGRALKHCIVVQLVNHIQAEAVSLRK